LLVAPWSQRHQSARWLGLIGMIIILLVPRKQIA
jgi:hypothetical protein